MNDSPIEPPLLLHSEDTGRISIDASSCPSGAARELQRFAYSRLYTPPEGDLLPGHQGCSCQGQCTAAACACHQECFKGLTALQALGRASGVVSLLECGPACACDPSCPARTTQQGLAVKVGLKWSQDKGWCVHAAQAIPQGCFVCQYVGEYVTAAAARQRVAQYDRDPDRGHALLTVRLQLPSQTSSLLCCIDATRTGNIARFINHSCDGGKLEAVLVTIRGCLLPRVALFAARDVAAGEELTYAYCCAGADDPAAAPSAGAAAEGEAAAEGGGEGGGGGVGGRSRRRCCCGTAACDGYLPSAL